MKRFHDGWSCLGLLAVLAVGLSGTGCKSNDDRSMAQKWGDRQVASGVKKELAKDPFYHYTDVVPVVHDGTVQLTGFVDTPEERQRAAELAAHAKGAQQVINTITLKPLPTGRVATRAPATNAPAPPTAEAAAPTGQETPLPTPVSKPNP